MRGPIIVTPDLVAAAGGLQLYLQVRNESSGPIPAFAVDVLMSPHFETPDPVFPPGYKLRGTRQVNLPKAKDSRSHPVHRFFWDWDRTRGPLLPGISEPLSEKPIVISRRSDLVDTMFIIQVLSPSGPSDLIAYRLGAQNALNKTEPDEIELGADPDVPWYRVA